ncbi:hypothetical protein H010_21091 [Hydrogenophaga taeniospiralis CCUG 15921]|uniref:Zeta toxin domain-containing protein n=1 Tax=Hydrogenophaga taeniospiralis CCUG 15921 TaxID=1281780 RepID=A0A9X4S9M1_9BURK|nr:zeta toxin family protein [Hydrogenophaga taeniospiralis]MDG5977762.1 hypothetical protein [Hydrogenophaga taeniospiralis CCUG 15921]
MAHDYPKIDPTLHQQIFNDKILQDSDYQGVTPQERPRAIIMAGQPGAGKGSLVKAASAELGGNVVTVDPDELRGFHPRAHGLRQQHPYTWSGQTHGDASQWATELRDAAIGERKNIILDTTTPRTDVIKDLQAKGYDVEVRAIASHRIESELGVDQRFTRQLFDEGYGRYVPSGVRDNVYQQLPSQLDAVARETGTPIRIYDREGQLHHDSGTQPKVLPSQALEAAREGRMGFIRVAELERSIHDQRRLHSELPERLPNAKVNAQTTTTLLQERQAQAVEKGLGNLATDARSANMAGATRSMGKGLGIAGTAYGVYQGVNDTRDAIDQARSNREQWVRGGEAGADVAARGTVTGLAGAGGGALGAAGGVLTSPVTGPVGPITGGIVVGGAAGVLADKAYEDSRLQQFSKALGREVGQLGYDYVSREGRLLRQVNGLREDLAAETDPAQRAKLETRLSEASEKFATEAERNGRFFEGKTGVENAWEKTHAQYPRLDKDDVTEALARHIDAGKRPGEAASAAYSDALHEKYPRVRPHQPQENYRAMGSEQLLEKHQHHTAQMVEDKRRVLELAGQKDSRNHLDAGWPQALAEQRQAQRVQDGLNRFWKDTGHVSAIRAALKERGIAAPELPEALQKSPAQGGPATPAQDASRQQQPQDHGPAATAPDGSQPPGAAIHSQSPQQAQHAGLAHAQLGPQLAARGHGPEQIERVCAAAVAHAQQHAHRGAVQAFHLSRDAQLVAVVQERAPMSEFRVDSALHQSADQHLERAHALAQSQAQVQAGDQPQAQSLQPAAPATARLRA